ncbi:GmrSD restriction endonuclease domain-containing protein [Anaerotardibacter muris]|uniref:GmrSD restriction endonuclease domain-containing protein n=1 Tax=Anaerotardibacter muris TaxID=2941505 RepID=UPI00203A401F|nr:DUF262 domain-containing protein [Anaerotardibacter muris]
MEITLREVPIREVYEGYINDGETEMGVTGYDDELCIRPRYQRNYVYKDNQRDEVIRTVKNGYPLSIFYWVDLGEDREDQDSPRFEVLDGQQRTISICDYIEGDFSVDGHFFESLPSDIRDKILDYKLLVYVCVGDDSEKLKWFETINIAGEPLTAQELRNAIYSGTWVSDAKKHFSKSNGAAVGLASDYMKGEANRQDYMETAIKWHMDVTGDDTIEEYMSARKNYHNAQELWSYFRSAIEWAEATFPKYRSQMKGLPWGLYYNAHHERTDLDPQVLEERISELMADPDVTNKKGIYEYVLTDNEKALSIRAFDDRTKREKYEEQKGICPYCKEHFEFNEMHGDHIIPWSKGGKTVPDNCQMVCIECNLKKSNN